MMDINIEKLIDMIENCIGSQVGRCRKCEYADLPACQRRLLSNACEALRYLAKKNGILHESCTEVEQENEAWND